MWATYNGQTETAKMLIDAKADVNAVNKDGKTALNLATANGHAEMIKILTGSSS
jgi:ankyrin repeat protein